MKHNNPFAALGSQFIGGLLNNNPTLVQLLGMCSTLAITTRVGNGIGMGLATTAVLIGSNVVISLLRKYIPSKIRIAAYVVIIAGFVSTVDMLMKAYLPALSSVLGIFIPLIVVNCIILARAESFASKNGVFASAIDGLAMGLGFTLALTLMSIIREIIGNGTIFGFPLMGKSYQPALMMVLPAGGFLTLACLIAAIQYIKLKMKGSAADDRTSSDCAQCHTH